MKYKIVVSAKLKSSGAKSPTVHSRRRHSEMGRDQRSNIRRGFLNLLLLVKEPFIMAIVRTVWG